MFWQVTKTNVFFTGIVAVIISECVIGLPLRPNRREPGGKDFRVFPDEFPELLARVRLEITLKLNKLFGGISLPLV